MTTTTCTKTNYSSSNDKSCSGVETGCINPSDGVDGHSCQCDATNNFTADTTGACVCKSGFVSVSTTCQALTKCSTIASPTVEADCATGG